MRGGVFLTNFQRIGRLKLDMVDHLSTKKKGKGVPYQRRDYSSGEPSTETIIFVWRDDHPWWWESLGTRLQAANSNCMSPVTNPWHATIFGVFTIAPKLEHRSGSPTVPVSLFVFLSTLHWDSCRHSILQTLNAMWGLFSGVTVGLYPGPNRGM